MITMDLKGIAWVGNMYEKFEAMCVEVEETMYQDTVQYVENQVRTVGASVKKFYSDVMQDLLPPLCIDPVKAEDPGHRLVHYNTDIGNYDKVGPKVDIKEEHVKFEVQHLIRDSSISPYVGERLDNGSPSMIHLCEPLSEDSAKGQWSDFDWEQNDYAETDSGCGENAGNKFPPVSRPNTSVSKRFDKAFINNELLSEEAKCNHEVSSPNLASVPEGRGTVICKKAAATNESVGSACGLTSCIMGSDKVENRGLEVAVSSYRDFSSDLDVLQDTELEGTIDENMWNGEAVDGKISVHHKGTSNCSNEIRSDDVDQGVLFNEQFDTGKLEESCVLVEKMEQCSMSQLEGKRRSYKKIRNAFSPRKWSKSKQQHGGLDKESGKNLSPTSLDDSGKKNSEPVETCDSEWELL
ncbi:hypothetical protein Ancab_007770 [Ancistrocladus abbreviatus]